MEMGCGHRNGITETFVTGLKSLRLNFNKIRWFRFQLNAFRQVYSVERQQGEREARANTLNAITFQYANESSAAMLMNNGKHSDTDASKIFSFSHMSPILQHAFVSLEPFSKVLYYCCLKNSTIVIVPRSCLMFRAKLFCELGSCAIYILRLLINYVLWTNSPVGIIFQQPDLAYSHINPFFLGGFCHLPSIWIHFPTMAFPRSFYHGSSTFVWGSCACPCPTR